MTEIYPIAHFRSPFSSKFGIPKQSGLVKNVRGQIVFEPAYRSKDALRGIDEFDYLWLIWHFSANKHAPNSLVVRPPLLGGNTKMGVFATRSPFRPNGLGLSSVQLERIEWETNEGPVIHVLGADLMDGTPIFDIKPYIVYADCHVGARSGFVDRTSITRLEVHIPESFQAIFPPEILQTLYEVLALDPRPHYQDDPHKVYGMPFMGRDVRFTVSSEGKLLVIDVV
ncbi:tRNA (N6-threonylcarbamoyladenosine(37)-N6)-methyltransferase TrmO [Hoylesella loescheii]|uniref:Methyltransferase, YaeB family n=1 Tax=Hoylesella loescheii DSM 19665 = JCM 12249 = ATCC 15930 TaxID=1122985 RepID=A0A069QNL2_HOYLO|nr:tRNA (N6-threonylcarbamoyladenosine(37)-N6)-methyltransferase TrmO [Hoylesella loescheii]KDR53589.1 methyltransferase, YaeB family [Hoylesella loescheii DSM 19665 = JCM 12249 = ATCC 15930]